MRFSRCYDLDKQQSELDFVDVKISKDIRLFLDPFAISQGVDELSQKCHDTLIAYFESLITAIRNGNDYSAKVLLRNLKEPNETRLGFSSKKPQGAGIGKLQSYQLLNALKKSSAVKTGFLSSLEETELMVEGIGRDKISDLTTNVIRRHLADYTKQQCELWNIPFQNVALSPYFSPDAERWINKYYELPVVGGKPVLLVPKNFVRYDPAYNHRSYYNQFVLHYLQTEHLSENSSLVTALKNGRRVVFKKDLKEVYPLSKEFLFQFSKQHPKVLAEYKKWLEKLEKQGSEIGLEEEDLIFLAESLISALKSIEPGNAQASEYHNLMIGALEFILYPNLTHPQKEKEIHDGRKRIDITMENGARSGIFYSLHAIRKLPCSHVAIECKNYSKDIANPELDQLAGRFSNIRGKFGILCCRSFNDRNLFIKRCRDTLKDDRGLIIPVDDNTLISWLTSLARGTRYVLNRQFTQLIDEVWLN